MNLNAVLRTRLDRSSINQTMILRRQTHLLIRRAVTLVRRLRIPTTPETGRSILRAAIALMMDRPSQKSAHWNAIVRAGTPGAAVRDFGSESFPPTRLQVPLATRMPFS